MASKKKKTEKVDENLIHKKVCADQVIRRLQDIQNWLKYALIALAIGVVVSPVAYWGVIPGVAGLIMIGMKFNQIKLEIGRLRQKYKLM